MKGTTRITIQREQLRELLEEYLGANLLRPGELKEFTIHRNGSIEMTVAAPKPAPLLEQAGEGEVAPEC